MATPVQQIFGNKLRLRVCGVCFQDNRVLLVNHAGLGHTHFWAPPGGGVELGEPAEQALIREFREETGLAIEVCDFLFACELIRLPLHAIELFFRVKITGGKLVTGHDPEMAGRQIIQEVRFFTENEVRSLPAAHLHGIFQKTPNMAQIEQLRGYYKL
ncbi:MAG: NUDIX hydrolase [Cyclobacteriaceae bacterium]|nr:NUDIX hydrolase [Cyclobacteriaceae bacterium]